MAPITTRVDVARPPAEVFAYVTDPGTMSEWQKGCLSGHMDGPATRVGSRCTTIRKIGGREREVTTEITAYDPPRRWADRGIDGPIRAIVAVAIEPLADKSGSSVTIELDFIGHGIGRLLVPLVVRRQAAGEMPGNMRRLKQRLDTGSVAEHLQEPGVFTIKVLNPLVGLLTRAGISIYGSRVLEVRGRSSGQWRQTPVNLLRYDGADYLVAPRGHTQWVKNLRASGQGRLRVGSRTREFTAVELADDEKPAVLRAYLKKWKFEVGVFFGGVGPESSDEELRGIAADHPVFHLTLI